MSSENDEKNLNRLRSVTGRVFFILILSSSQLLLRIPCHPQCKPQQGYVQHLPALHKGRTFLNDRVPSSHLPEAWQSILFL